LFPKVSKHWLNLWKIQTSKGLMIKSSSLLIYTVSKIKCTEQYVQILPKKEKTISGNYTFVICGSKRGDFCGFVFKTDQRLGSQTSDKKISYYRTRFWAPVHQVRPPAAPAQQPLNLGAVAAP
jgi:hypothetical protein